MTKTLEFEAPVLEERLIKHYHDNHQVGIIYVDEDIVNARIDEETVLAALDHIKDVILPDYGRRMRASPYGSPTPEMKYRVPTEHDPDTLKVNLRYIAGSRSHIHATFFQEFSDQHHNLVHLEALTKVVKVPNAPG